MYIVHIEHQRDSMMPVCLHTTCIYLIYLHVYTFVQNILW